MGRNERREKKIQRTWPRCGKKKEAMVAVVIVGGGGGGGGDSGSGVNSG